MTIVRDGLLVTGEPWNELFFMKAIITSSLVKFIYLVYIMGGGYTWYNKHSYVHLVTFSITSDVIYSRIPVAKRLCKLLNSLVRKVAGLIRDKYANF